MTTSTSAAEFAPLAAAQRIQAMDVLRGFALAGILLMNIEGLAGPLAGALTGLDPALVGADRMVDLSIFLLVQGKFYLLFSLLFGMGFAVMAQRAEAAGRSFVGIYLRRSFVLFGLGLVHALLIWSGDILLSYALLSFLLPLFRQVPGKWLPWLGMAAYLLPVGFMLLLGALGSSMALASPEASASWNQAMQQAGVEFQGMLDGQRAAYGSGGYLEATAQRLRDTRFMLQNLVIGGGTIFGMFLIGASFVRSGAIARPEDFPTLYALLRWVAAPLGLLLVLAGAWLSPTMNPARLDLHEGIAAALTFIGNLGLCLGYVAWLMRGLASPSWRKPLVWLAPAGRMALTNYLAQSIVCTLLFYHYGLGYFEQLPRAWQLPFSLALFVLQVVLSHWWLQRFRFGPVEWLWRTLTYLKRQPMRMK